MLDLEIFLPLEEQKALNEIEYLKMLGGKVCKVKKLWWENCLEEGGKLSSVFYLDLMQTRSICKIQDRNTHFLNCHVMWSFHNNYDVNKIILL